MFDRAFVHDVYATIYRGKRRYGTNGERVATYVEYLRARIPVGSSVCDFGCGRGRLLAALADAGFTVAGTEICEALLGGRYGVTALWYEDLSIVPTGRYDAVVSSDVLEHLQSEDDAACAIEDLARIARQLVCISVGLTPVKVRCVPSAFNGKQLHIVMKPFDWWTEAISRHVDVDYAECTPCGNFIFGRVKGATGA